MARATSQDSISKTAAVKAAISAGILKPKQIVEYAKETYGVELTPLQVSVIKSKAKHAAPKMASTKAHTNGTAHDAAELARCVKLLVGSYGAPAVKGMVDVFSG